MRYSNSNKDSTARKDDQKTYFGNYLGIVVQNNDPSKRGRLKIYIPHVSATIYERWYKIPVDKRFSFIGKNIDSDLSGIIDDLKEILPWADCASPIAGSSSSGRYNANKDEGFVSDSSKLDTTVKDTRTQFSKYSLNDEGIGEKPAYSFETKETEISDGFSTVTQGITGMGAPNKINKYSYQYKPNSYSNQAKGSFSIPNVGAHVWVFFINGDPNLPVYFASSFSTRDWEQIYDSSNGQHGVDYPGSYENKSKDDVEYNHNTEQYRNKFVINQKGGTLEFVNTDNREILKLTHYSGSFKEFNNESSIELNTGQDQKLVLGDQFSTVKGHKNDMAMMDYDLIVRGDYYKKIGTFNREKFKEWQEAVKVLGDIKQLFEIKRAEFLDEGENLYIQSVSPLQTKSPTGKQGHALCPVCCHPNRPKMYKIDNKGPTLRIPSITTIANQFLGSITGFVLPLQTGLPRVFDFAQPDPSPANFLGSGKCPACDGDGRSPSTFGGDFDVESKNEFVESQINKQITTLANIERELGLGGSEIVNITKHKHENIGLLMNDLPSIRVDKVGKLSPSEVLVLKEGVILNQAATPLIEYVHTDEMPGGNYTINAANKFNVQAGSNGISFKTYGPVDIGGTIVNVAGEQVNIGSNNEVNINAGRVSIIADILSMRQRDYKQVVIESNLGVAGNAVVRGSLHVEGELSVQHITSPVELKETDTNKAFGQINPVRIGTCIIAGGSSSGAHAVYGFGSSPMATNSYEHSHVYESIPLTILRDSDSVRTVGMQTSAQMETPPQSVQNGGFLTKVTDKLGEVVDGALGDFEI